MCIVHVGSHGRTHIGCIRQLASLIVFAGPTDFIAYLERSYPTFQAKLTDMHANVFSFREASPPNLKAEALPRNPSFTTDSIWIRWRLVWYNPENTLGGRRPIYIKRLLYDDIYFRQRRRCWPTSGSSRPIIIVRAPAHPCRIGDLSIMRLSAGH